MATPRMAPQHLACEDLAAHPDRLRGLREGMVETPMEAEVSARRGTGDGVPSGRWCRWSPRPTWPR